MAERETEFKFLLTDAEHGKIAETLSGGRTVRFANRYFGVGSTERQDWVLRLRLTDEKKELTLKIGREVEPGLFDSTEYSCLVDSEEPADWEETEPLKVLRAEISEEPVDCLGEARNTRLKAAAPIEVGEVWELDRSELPDGTSFCELEIEVRFQDEAELTAYRQKLETWLHKLGVEGKPSEKTKYARFLAAIG